jgi:hypothetical protein
MAIGPYDVLIAGQAIARDMILITHNTGEFGRVPGCRSRIGGVEYGEAADLPASQDDHRSTLTRLPRTAIRGSAPSPAVRTRGAGEGPQVRRLCASGLRGEGPSPVRPDRKPL